MPTVTLSPAPRTAAPTIETPRLRLRRWRDQDTVSYAKLLRNDDLMRYLGSVLRYRLKRAAGAVVASFTDIEARRAIRKLVVGRTQWRRSDVCWYAIGRDERERRRGNDS